MKKVILAAAVLVSAFSVQNAFALKFICQEKEGPKTKTPIHVSVNEKMWDHATVHRPNSGHHSILPCEQKETGDIVCAVSWGNPDLGGGCGNAYMQEIFTVKSNGDASYFYVNNGFIYQRYDYECHLPHIDG